jgi:uncharacterized protein
MGFHHKDTGMDMHPKETLSAALKEAMKSKQNERRDVLRSLLSAIKQVEIDTRADVTPDQVITVLQKEVKSHRETITELGKSGGDHSEMVAQSEFAIVTISEFLPQQMTHEEIEALVKAAIAETGATGAKEMGKVMGVLQPQTKGRADGKLVSEIVKSLLG